MKVPSWFLLLRALCEHWCEQVHTPSINTIWNINCGEHCRPYKTSIGTKWKYWAPNFRQHWQKEASYQFWCGWIRCTLQIPSRYDGRFYAYVNKQTVIYIYGLCVGYLLRDFCAWAGLRRRCSSSRCRFVATSTFYFIQRKTNRRTSNVNSEEENKKCITQ